MRSGYIELHAASAFSFLEGASTPEALIDRAAALGYPSLALVDRDGVYGAPRFHMAARAAGIKAIVGSALTIRDGGATPAGLPRPPVLWRLPVLVASREGYRNLCRLVTSMKLASPKGEGALSLDDLDGHTGGLVALVGGQALFGGRHGVGGLLDRVIGAFGRRNVYIELQRHCLRDEEADNHVLHALAEAFHVPVVATNDVRFAQPEARPLYDVLTCVRHKITLARAGRRLARNAERYLKPPEEMARLFADHPRAVAETRELADRLEYTLAELGYRFPEYPVPPGETMASFLHKMTEIGARERYRPFHDRARAQVARELELIEKLELAGYFLIVWDLVNFCRQRGILVQGRGSAANSAVCYSLGITAVDPVGMELLFERFLSEERGEWPDIDLDLPSGDRREQVIQYVYQRYGQRGAAMTANVITYRGRSAAREVGKALGLEAWRVDRLAKAMQHFEWRDPKDTLDRQLRDIGEDPSRQEFQRFADLWRQIQHLPRHLGQHSGGMVMCQGRLDEVVPLENASMPGRVVVQWDKDDCADMGIVKVDLLGLGMMAVLQDALSIVNAQIAAIAEAAGRRPFEVGEEAGHVAGGRPEFLDLAHLPPDDPAVYRMLQRADTVGVFQVESRAQMATLPRLRPTHFYDLVVEVALIRPGPIVGQMVHPYLRRRAGREAVAYAHPSLEPILKRTLGVPLFQEQLLRMAMTVAGFTGGQAEELRRAMGFKRSEERMRAIEGRLREGMAARGITDDAADQIVRSITSFALYGFPESHAASFALIVYASAYLKAHYPAAFYTALLNNQPMGFYHPATIVKDAQRHGVRFAPIDVQASDWLCKVEPDGAIRLGLVYVHGLREEVGRVIERRGPQQPAAVRDTTRAEPRPADLRELEGCPKCGNDDPSMLEIVETGAHDRHGFCSTCAHAWQLAPHAARTPSVAHPSSQPPVPSSRFASLDDFVSATGIRRDEVTTLAEVGALNAFGYDRRSALWQVERAVRRAGELVEASRARAVEKEPPAGRAPLPAMSLTDRVVADYAGTGVTIGPHPMALRRTELAQRGVWRSSDLPRGRHGRRVRVAGAVITRQRPGTAKGFVFLTLEDETGLANVIVQPHVFDASRAVVVSEPFLIVEGLLQVQDGVTSVKAEHVFPLSGPGTPVVSRDFH